MWTLSCVHRIKQQGSPVLCLPQYIKYMQRCIFQWKMCRCLQPDLDRWPRVTFWQQVLTFWSVICSVSALSEQDTNLWSADHIVSYYVSVTAEEQHLFQVPGSQENNVSEPVDFFHTLVVISPAEISWLVPCGGNVNRYFRGADVWIIWLARFILHYTENTPHPEQQSEFFMIKENASHICKLLQEKSHQSESKIRRSNATLWELYSVGAELSTTVAG